MYKKIKNSSFMNLLWFLIAVLPLLFFAIYSISFFDKEEKEISYTSVVSDTNLIVFDNTNFGSDSMSFNSSNYLVGNISSSYDVIYSSSSGLDGSYRFYYYIPLDNQIYQDSAFHIYLMSLDGSTIYFDIDNLDNYYYDFNLNINDFMIIIVGALSSPSNDFFIKLFLTDDVSHLYSYSDINSNSLFSLSYDTIFYKNIYNNFNDYLEAFNNSIFTNGFIANMFISLLNYFNVSSIYLRIFSYYLEYLILISLLHLAFDFVLLVPNICHKFMERVGGERD